MRRSGMFSLILMACGILSLLAMADLSQAQCTTEACQACRNAGYWADDICSFPVHRSRIQVRERFIYVGQPEGHDRASNLLWGCRAFSPTPSVCNISRGTCVACDEGCRFCPPSCFACEGMTGEPACCYQQECVGEWSGTASGPWRSYSQVSEVTVTSNHPADCDCWACHTGWRGYYTVRSYNGDFAGEARGSIGNQCVSDAGCIYHKGWDGVHLVDRGYICGWIGISGCTYSGVVIVSTISRSLRWADPDYYIPPGPACYSCP